MNGNRFKGSSTARFVKSTPNYNKFGNNQPKNSYNGKSNAAKLNMDSMSKVEAAKKIDEIDAMMGFNRYETGPKRTGWLINFHPTIVPSPKVFNNLAACDFYFLDEEGGSFKTTVQYNPYFFLLCRNNMESEIEDSLKKKLEGIVKSYKRVEKDDLDLPNHLIGLKRNLLKLTFHNLTDLLDARRILNPIIQDNQKKKDARDVYSAVNINYNEDDFEISGKISNIQPLDYIDDIKEYDVPYHVRVAIDKNLRVGKWYSVEAKHDNIAFKELDIVAPPDPVVLAFDIETSKAPLKFPDATVDQIMMISYMIDGEGYLITNREIISKDIEDFEYTPKPEYPGYFEIYNAENEEALIRRFFEHIREVKPTVISTFNGDFFDWPFVDARANFHHISMFDEIGFLKDSEDEYKSTYCAHMDCFRWVKRDSYLPQGSQGLKAVTTVKLGYNPIELDPELMTPYAIEKPQVLSEYSVSDAVATYYLYYKYVHPFIFSLATIIPLNPDEVLRKGTGTLCEMLLMVQAYNNNILLPNKHKDPLERFHNGHLLEAETYVGGHVESLEAGVFRSDLNAQFKIDPTVIDSLLANVDDVIRFFVSVECQKKIEDISNFEEISSKIKDELMELKKNPKRDELPLIYHVDVASMYPNIMISNRLQPDSMKTESNCASCDFNRPGKQCDRMLTWSWRGEFYPAKMDEYGMIKRAIKSEMFKPIRDGFPKRTFDELSSTEQAAEMKKRISDYSRKVYRRIKTSETIDRESIVCQRENPFYIDTVRSFRDRRYTYKGLAKKWKKKVSAIDKSDPHAIEEAKKMVITYDSLQLAHKVILNSFYGYVMRKGSRWYSMEMAGITCLTGATIIQMARALIERFGRPLELDTDGIWCIIPSSFPDEFNIAMKDGSKLSLPYLCSMLNHLVHLKFTNHQYQELVPNGRSSQYRIKSENSIFFELDGPYKAMILPTSKEEGKGIKKRYAVFNFDGSLAELKGFELKRRGELQIVKNMQGDLFPAFLEGDSLENCYAAVALVANKWLDILLTKGANIEDEDLINLIGEKKSMSKSIAEYNGMKSTSITTVRRLVEFLGIDIKDGKGMTAQFIIANKPQGAPVAERAIPIAIFSADLSQKRIYLRKWLRDNNLEDFDARTILDWDYYFERLASVVLKIISIPAYMQIKKNPCEKVTMPSWILQKIEESKVHQTKLTNFFKATNKVQLKVSDIEDYGKKTVLSDKERIKIGRSKTSKKRKLLGNKDAKGENNESIALKEKEILDSGCPDPSVDYVGWLEYNKIIWKMDSEKNAANKKIFGEYTKNTVSNMFQNQTRQYASNNEWQVLEYILSVKPGEAKAKVLISGKIQEIRIKVPKEIYITMNNSLQFLSSEEIREITREQNVISIEKSNLIISKNTKPVYKVKMNETTFTDLINQPGSFLQKANIFENEITAMDRMIIDKGNMIRFKSDELGGLYKGLQFGFNSENLEALDANNSNNKYLTPFKLDIIYILHIQVNSYEIYAVCKPWGDDAEIYFFILKPSEEAQEFPKSLNTAYSDLYDKHEKNFETYSSILKYPSQCQVHAQHFTNFNMLIKKLNSKISSIHEERPNNSILAVQSPYVNKLLSTTIKSSREFSILRMPPAPAISLPALQWQMSLSKHVFVSFFSLSSWVSDALTSSAASCLPLCNVRLDDYAYLIDIDYARRLKKGGMVLWWTLDPSNNDKQDRSSTEERGTRSIIPITESESLLFPSINHPDTYESIVLEILVGNLAINTVLASALINVAEGSDLADVIPNEFNLSGFNNSNNGKDNNEKNGTISNPTELTGEFSGDSFNVQALTILRNMVKDWWDSAIKKANNHAEMLVNNFIKWMQSRQSYLYDPKLEYHVFNSSKKVLLQMLKEFKKMGSSVVHADRNAIWLRTSKNLIENLYAYSQYILKTIRSKPMFGCLQLKIEKYWDILIWMDEYNFAGRACYEIVEGKQDLQSFSKWQISKFLPPIYENEFISWIAVYMDKLIEEKQESLADEEGNFEYLSTQHTKIMNRDKRQNITENNRLNLEEEEIDMKGKVFEESKVLGALRSPLVKRIKKLYNKQNQLILNEAYREEYQFPKLPGSHLKMSNPTLELVKMICAVFGISRKGNLESRSIRKELLGNLDVKEFSEESAFKNPSVSLKIPLVLCFGCESIRDIDFCKEEEHDIWQCPSCLTKYNKVGLEERLIKEFEQLITMFYIQDMKCEKCSKIRKDEMSSLCSCSGSWIGLISRKSLLRKIQILENVAVYYDLKLLQDAINAF